MNFAITEGIVVQETNPFNKMFLKTGKKPKKTITQDEVSKCLVFLNDSIQDEEIKNFSYPAQFWITVIKVLQCTGMRTNQLLHIRIGDVNIKNKTIFLCEEGSKTYLEREIPVIDDVFDEVVRLRDGLLRLNCKPSTQLFNIYHFKNMKSKHYKEMESNKISAFFQKLSINCGTRITPHRFRHGLATDLMKHPDRNITLVKELLGHSSVSTTLEYISTDKEQLRMCLSSHFDN